MAFSFGGEFQVQRRPESVYEFLTNPQMFCPLMPDFQSIAMQDPTHFIVKLNVGVSHIRGVADVKMELARAERPCRAEYKGQGAVPGGNVALTAGFELSPEGEATRVAWKGGAQVSGRIISMAGGLLEPLAKKNIQKMIDALQQALSADAAAQPAAEARRG
jgi:uncharacterized protein